MELIITDEHIRGAIGIILLGIAAVVIATLMDL